jgi:GUN4-like/ARM-like repeat domain, GUN4-N terminal
MASVSGSILMSDSSTTLTFSAFKQKFDTATEKNRVQLLTEIDNADPAALEFLQAVVSEPMTGWPTLLQGKAYQLLYDSPLQIATDFLQREFPLGIVPLKSDAGVEYQDLQELLVDRNWQAADKLTNLKLCELAGPVALQRQWLYFTDINTLPNIDLQTIDRLWWTYSEGLFGFKVQRDLWLSVGKNWEKLWPKIGWKDGIYWTRYPGSFTWDMSAPRGHLPLSNQLRGVRSMAALLAHPAWQ